MLVRRSALIVLAVVAALLPACGAQGGSQGGGDAPEGVSHGGGAGGDPTPVLTGTWEGTFETEGREARTSVNLEQGADGKLAGSGSIAVPPDVGGAVEDVAGHVEGPEDVRFSYVTPGEGADIRWSFEGALKEGSISEMEGKLSVAAEGGGGEADTGTFELTRYPDLSSDPRALAVAAVQAVHDRNFFFLAENGHPEYEEYLEDAFPAPTFAESMQEQFVEETTLFDGEDPFPPPAGVEVLPDEVEVVDEAEEGYAYATEFNYGLSNGAECSAEVALGAVDASGGSRWTVRGIMLEYEFDNSDRTMVLGESY